MISHFVIKMQIFFCSFEDIEFSLSNNESTYSHDNYLELIRTLTLAPNPSITLAYGLDHVGFE